MTLAHDLLIAAPLLHVQALLTVVHVVAWQVIWLVVERGAPSIFGRFAFFNELSDVCWRIIPVPKGLPPPDGAIADVSQRGGFDTKRGFTMWLWIGIHHLLAGGLVSYSFLVGSDDGACFRHGALLSLGGVDILQLLQMMGGSSPFDDVTPPIPLVQDVRVPLILHHFFGIVVILPANLLLSTDEDAQLVAVSALVASAVNTYVGCLIETWDPLKPCNRHSQLRCYVAFGAIYSINCAVFVYFRWRLFPAAAYRAALKFGAIDARLGFGCGFACLLLAGFNTAVVSVMAGQMYDLITGLRELTAAKSPSARAEILDSPASPARRALQLGASGHFATSSPTLRRLQSGTRWPRPKAE